MFIIFEICDEWQIFYYQKISFFNLSVNTLKIYDIGVEDSFFIP